MTFVAGLALLSVRYAPKDPLVRQVRLHYCLLQSQLSSWSPSDAQLAACQKALTRHDLSAIDRTAACFALALRGVDQEHSVDEMTASAIKCGYGSSSQTADGLTNLGDSLALIARRRGSREAMRKMAGIWLDGAAGECLQGACADLFNDAPVGFSKAWASLPKKLQGRLPQYLASELNHDDMREMAKTSTGQLKRLLTMADSLPEDD